MPAARARWGKPAFYLPRGVASAARRGSLSRIRACEAKAGAVPQHESGAHLEAQAVPARRARGDLAQQLTGNAQPFSIRPEHIRFASGERGAGDLEISGLLHDIQYQGAATRYEIRLDNGQNLCLSQANSQWDAAAVAHQPGQRVTARWAREAMVALNEGA